MAELTAALYGVQLVFIPPYHCTLNPIEHVWAFLKGKLCRTATAMEKLDEIRTKAIEILNGMELDLSRRFFDDAKKNELDYITKEDLQLVPYAIVADCDAEEEAAEIVEDVKEVSDVEEEPEWMDID